MCSDTAWFQWIKDIAKDCTPNKNTPAWFLICVDRISSIIDKIMNMLGTLLNKMLDWLKNNIPIFKKLFGIMEKIMAKIGDVRLL